MSIQGAFNDLSQFIGNYGYTTQQAALSVVLELKELRSNPDVYQKIGQIAYASLQLMIESYASAAPFARLSSLISSAVGMHDFYRVVQYPRHWFFPVTADVINEFTLREDIVLTLAEKIGMLDLNGLIIDEDLYVKLEEIVQFCVNDQLERMASQDDAYRNLNEFITQLQQRLKEVKSIDFDFTDIDLFDVNDLKHSQYDTSEWFRSIPTVEKIMNINWAVVDSLAAAWWFKEWNVLDTAKLAETIGQYSPFQWVKNQELEHGLLGLICTGCAWNVLESVRLLRDEALTTEQIRKARWNVVTSVADFAFFGTIFTNTIGKTQVSHFNVNLLALCARTLGLISIVTRPRHKFFQIPEDASAA